MDNFVVGSQFKGTVVLLFDDGFQDQYTNALPTLLQYHFNATFGIITGLIGSGSGDLAYLNNNQIKTWCIRRTPASGPVPASPPDCACEQR